MDQINLLSKVEYLVMFNAILYGIVASEFFIGWGRMSRNFRITKFYWVHLLWTGLAFGLLIDIWWDSWSRGEILTSDIWYFYSSLITPLLFHFITVILFPKLKSGTNGDFKLLFYLRKNKLFTLFGVFFFSNLILSPVFAENNIYVSENAFRITAIVLSIAAIIIDNTRFHKILILVSMLLLIIHHIEISLDDIIIQVESIDGFSKVEYLITFYAILFGIVAFEYFQGWGLLLQFYNEIRIYWVHLLWSVFTFGMLVDIWWISWTRVSFVSINIGYFTISLLTPFLFYIGSVILFPDFDRKDNRDLKEYFYKVKKWFFLVFGMYFLINIVNSYFYNEIDIYPEQNLYRFAGILFCIPAILTNNQLFHKIFAVLAIVLLVFHHLQTY